MAPFLAEEGVDLDGVYDGGLDSLNEALAKATARYNQSLPPAGGTDRMARNVAGSGSPFVREPAAPASVRPGVREIGSAPSRRAASGRRQSDQALVREFEKWLRHQQVIAAPSVAEEAEMFGGLLEVARRGALDPRSPGGVAHLVELFATTDAPDSDDAVAAALATLHDYVHFQLDASGDPEVWEDIHDLVDSVLDEPLPGTDILAAAIAASDELDSEVRRDALAGTLLVAQVGGLLEWIGRGRKVAPSGGLRRVDIAHVAGLLGIAAVGVAKLPPSAPDSAALFELPDAAPDEVLHARAMKDVPLLPSWWEALIIADLITLASTRVVPGPSAFEWQEGPLPLELAETVVGVTVAEFVLEDLEHPSMLFADQLVGRRIGRLLRALAPDEVEPVSYSEHLGRLLNQRVTRDLARLESVGVLVADSDEFVVPPGLRGAVARGVLAAIAMLASDPADD